MPIIILHGNGLAGISNKLSQIKKSMGEGVSVTELSGKNTGWGEAKLEFATTSLFDPQRLVILEDFKEVRLEDLPQDENITVVLKFTKALTAASPILKGAPKFRAQVFVFTEEHEGPIFPFLDFLAEKDPKALRELEKNLEDWGEQYVLTMIYYLLRRYIQTPKRLPPFVIQKMARQKKNFPIERIEELYRATLETDFKIKQGELDPKIGMFLLTEKFLN